MQNCVMQKTFTVLALKAAQRHSACMTVTSGLSQSEVPIQLINVLYPADSKKDLKVVSAAA